MESIDIIIRAVNRAKTTLNEVGRELKDVGQEAKKLDKDTSKKAVAGLRQWRGELEKTKKSVKSLHDASQSIVDVSKKLLMAGAAMGAAVFFPIKQAGEFESAMAKVRAIMTDVSEETFERMKAQARSLGETTQYTATQSAEAFTFLAMAGLSAIEAMEALPGTLQLAAAGGLELAVAADLATNVLAGLGFEVDELGRVNDVLARAASRANTSVWELGEAMKIAGPAAKGSKEEFEAIVAVLGGMADAGIKGGEAGNAVKRMLILLQNPTAKARAELTKLNVPLTDSEGKFRGLIPILQDLGEAQMDLSASAKIFGLYTGAAAIAAAGSAEKMGVLAEELRNADGAAKEMAATMQDTMKGALTLLKSAIEGFMLAVAGPLTSVFKDILKTMAETVSMVTALMKAIDPIGSVLLGILSVAGLLTLALGGVGIVVGGLVYGFAQFQVVRAMVIPTLKYLSGVVTTATASMALQAGIVGKLKAVYLGLATVLKAHPILFIGTVLIGIYVYIKQLVPEWKKLNEEAEKLRQEADKLSAVFDKVYTAFKKTTKGSNEQKEAAIKLKDELLELAKENDNVADEAIKAADSIERATGKILDSGKALEKFELVVAREQFKAFSAEATAASAKLESIIKKIEFPSPSLKYFIALFKDMGSTMLHSFPTIDALKKHFAEMDDQALKAINAQRTKAALLIRDMIKLKLIDPSLGWRQFQTYIKSLGPMSEQMASFYFDAFLKIKIAQAETAQAGTDITRRSLDEQNILLIRQTNKQKAVLLKLKKAYEEAKTAAEIDPTDLAAIKAQNDAYRAMEETIGRYGKKVRALRDVEIKIAQKAADAKINIIEDEVSKGTLAKERGEMEKIRILAEGARIEAEIRVAAAKRVEEALGKESSVYKKMSAVAKKAADEAYVAKAEALDMYEVKLRETYEKAQNEVKKYANEVIRCNEKIAEINMSTEDKIRSARRKVMTEYEQWLDKRRQGDEKAQAARAALEEDNFVLAKKLAKQAESLYGDLATKIETTVGGQKRVIVSMEEGVGAAVKGYDVAKKILLDIAHAQKSIAEDTKIKWESMAQTIKTTLDMVIFDREMDVDINLENIAEAASKITELTRDREVYITPVVKEMVGGFIKKFAGGGHLPGFGGGDRVNALLEAGEFVIRKEAVRKYGSWFFDMWNSMKFKVSDIGSIITNRLSDLQPHAQLGYQMGGLVPGPQSVISMLPNMGRIELVVGSGAYPVIADVNVIEKLKLAITKEKLLRTN